MDNVWFQSALWMALALLAAMGSLYITISAALFEIVVGAIIFSRRARLLKRRRSSPVQVLLAFSSQ
jgi:hypothetical protein